jgi:hypothetical protein
MKKLFLVFLIVIIGVVSGCGAPMSNLESTRKYNAFSIQDHGIMVEFEEVGNQLVITPSLLPYSPNIGVVEVVMSSPKDYQFDTSATSVVLGGEGSYLKKFGDDVYYVVTPLSLERMMLREYLTMIQVLPGSVRVSFRYCYENNLEERDYKLRVFSGTWNGGVPPLAFRAETIVVMGSDYVVALRLFLYEMTLFIEEVSPELVEEKFKLARTEPRSGGFFSSPMEVERVEFVSPKFELSKEKRRWVGKYTHSPSEKFLLFLDVSDRLDSREKKGVLYFFWETSSPQ